MQDADSRRLTDLIAAQAARTPDAVAISDGSSAVTFAELMTRAGSIADRLRAAGGRPNAIVAVCADRSAELAIALVGILLADCAYLPLDPAHPVLRLTHMISESGAIAVLADERLHQRMRQAGRVSVVPLDATGLAGASVAGSPAPSASDLAYVIYTSGSTGKPKGVGVPHRGVLNRLVWMQQYLGFSAGDVVLQKTPYTFDVSVWEFFLPLIAGARLVMAAPDVHRDPEHLVDVIRRERVTTMHFVPSMMEAFVREPGVAECRSLRTVIASGEALTSSLANRFAAVHDAELHNFYGPTEASIDVTAWKCRRPEPGASVPIGFPIDGVTAHVVGPDGAPCALGEQGELLIGGVCLARGYIGRPDLTERSFVPGPDGATVYRTGDLARWHPDGYLEYLGRADHQVKLRGMRIELGEIEAVLTTHQGVCQAVVLVRDDVGPAARLVAYVVPTDTFSVTDLRDHLTARLPDYMLPSYVMALDEIPVTVNGKSDRQALPLPLREHLLPVGAR